MTVQHSFLAALRSLGVLAVVLLLSPALPAWASLWPTSGWPTATPESMGMSPTLLAQARDYAVSQGGGAGYITRGGALVMSWGISTQMFEVKSTTKSIGVTILGLSIKDGLVSQGDRAIDHYSGFGLPPSENGTTGWLDTISLEGLATHAAGFEKAGGFINTIYEPNTTWAYSDGGANWLADVLTIVYGQDLRSVLFSRVLDPLGVTSTDLTWRVNAYRDATIEGITRREFGSGISANVDALARIGYLYLRNGMWEDAQLIPPTFVNAVRTPVPSILALPVDDPANYPDASQHYGLLWWNNADGTLPGVPLDAYWSWGLGEALIVVIPSLDVVVARAGGAWQPGWSTDYSILEPFLEPIAESVYQPVSVTYTTPVPHASRLGPIAPSPFRSSTDVQYSVSRAGPVSLAIFDIQGRRIRHWNWDNHPAGGAVLRWDGLGDSGKRASGGVYFIQLRENGRRQSAKTILLD